jgi:hypothetical protein
MSAYLQRILGLLEDHDPIAVLNATPQRLAALVELAAAGDLERSYAPGKWDVRHLLAHLADVEIGMGFRIRQTLAEPGIELQPFDQDAWARRYARSDPGLAVEAFRGMRAWNLSLFATLGLEDWLAEAYHPERGFESVDVMVRFLAGHDLNHLMQLERVLVA